MILREEKRNLFTVSEDYALAHCISADFALGAGIAKQFRDKLNIKKLLFEKYKNYHLFYKKELVNTIGRSGDCLIVDDERTVFNLVTKQSYWNKPTYESLEQALEVMKKQCINLKIKKIAMPQIGCGLDQLEWIKVSEIIDKVFNDTDIEILVCYL